MSEVVTWLNHLFLIVYIFTNDDDDWSMLLGRWDAPDSI